MLIRVDTDLQERVRRSENENIRPISCLSL